MKMRNILTIILLLFVAGNSFSQKFSKFSDDSEQFLSEMNSLVGKINDNEDKKTAEKMMEQFVEYWQTGMFTKETKENIKSVCNLMLKRRMKTFPDFYYYLSANMYFMDYDHSDKSYIAWQTSIEKLVSDKRSSKPIRKYLETSYSLLSENILYKSRATSWRSSTYEFYFDFDTVPKVVFDNLNLICKAYNDSSVIYDTKGVYYPVDNRWIGKKGRVNWSRAGYSDNMVYALLNNYDIYLGFSRYSADSVKFFHKNYWQEPLFGSLEEKVLANVTEEKATYPQFKTYFAVVEINPVFEGVRYKGGIEIKGRKLIGIGDRGNPATLVFSKDKKDFVRVWSENYTIYPDRISSALATATIYYEEDSIFHPGLKMNYVDERRELSLVRASEGASLSPYYDSFHNLDIYAEAIYWKMDEPLLNFETLKGLAGVGKATFESSSYFSEPRYLRLQGIDPQNPLNVVRNYAVKYNVSEVSVQGLAEEMLMSQDQVIAMLVNLSNKGFVIYERDERKARVKDKLFEYIDAVNRKRDYDVIQFNSEITGAGQNAILELDSFDLKLFGVNYVFLSDSQNVFIYPKNRQLIIKKGMDFTFSGIVHAGTFDFFTQQVHFNYDQFKLDMPVIDSMRFTVPSFEKDEFGYRKQKKVKNVVSNLGGDLYIDDPNNKSGLKNFPQYPIFMSTKDAYVYYDARNIFNGVYNRDEFYFYLYPFNIDSLDNFKTELLQFEGYLASAGIFDDIEDTLRVQRDYSLGFETHTPSTGMEAYGGKGTYFERIKLSNEGLRGRGHLNYLTSTSWSDDYMFFPDSCNTFADKFIVNEQLTPIEYPAVNSFNVYVHWVPYEDYMQVKNMDLPFVMFNEQSKLDGELVVTPEQIEGAGLMSFEDAEMKSELYSFKQHEIFADSADFNLKSAEYVQSAFATTNYKSHIDFNERTGHFVSNGGASYVDFPINQYICLIDEFNWYMDSYEIAIGSREKEVEMAKYNDLSIRELIDVPLQGSRFVSTHPDQDSLSFISTTANYNLKEYTLYAEDVKYIRVADAAIFPADRKIVVKPDAKMNTIADANILTNSVTRYHEIYDAVVDIRAKRDYNGIGNYDYVDETGYRQQVFLREINVDQTYQSVGNGKVADTSGFKLSKEFYFTGDVTLSANNQFLNFNGGFKIREQCNKGIPEWIKFNSDINPKDIYINIDQDLFSLKTDKIESGIMFSNESNEFYSGFLTKKKAQSDQRIIGAHGYLRYDRNSDKYLVGSEEKLKGLTIEGNQLSMNRRLCILQGEGELNLGADLGRVKMDTYGDVTYYMIPDSTSFEMTMLLDFPFDDKLLQVMAEEINTKNLRGVDLTKNVFLKALTDILGSKDAEKEIADLRLFGKFKKYPSELQRTIVITDLKLKWNYASRSYISYGSIGLSSVGKDQVNKYVKGYVEVEKKRTGDVINLYFEFDNGRNWYFFNCRNNLMQSISSNTEFNNYLRELKDDKRKVKKDKEGEEYSYIISNLRKKTDFLRRVK